MTTRSVWLPGERVWERGESEHSWFNPASFPADLLPHERAAVRVRRPRQEVAAHCAAGEWDYGRGTVSKLHHIGRLHIWKWLSIYFAISVRYSIFVWFPVLFLYN